MNTRLLGLGTLLFLLLVVVLPPATGMPVQVQSKGGMPQSHILTAQEKPGVDPVPQSTPAKPSIDINVSQEEYQDALARWRAQDVVEYQITLVDSTYMAIGGEARLHFKVEQGHSSLISYTNLSGDQPEIFPVATLSSDELEFWQSRSVEGMFQLIGLVFRGESSSSQVYGDDYDVAFHPTLGYPLHVHSRVLPAHGLSPTECCIYYEVLHLKIIRYKDTPGMPKTGAADY